MKILEKSPNIPDAVQLMDELSMSLEAITGDSGRISFDPKEISGEQAIFVIAYDDCGEAIGCGAIRPINEFTGEIKRMYAKSKGKGVGTEILNYLEVRAKELGYSTLWLETRLINNKAVSFYERRGYHCISNYGKYVNWPEAICFEKCLF